MIRGFGLQTSLVFFLTVVGILFTSPVVFAQQATSSSMTKGANQATRIATIKTKAEAEIDKRLASLHTAATKITAATKLSATDKATFSSQIQSNITTLTTLRAKIDADTDLPTLRTDAKSIYANFRIYAVFLPQVHMLATIDTMGVAVDNLTTLATKLQTRIQTAQQSGKDVSSVQRLLTDLQAKIADAKTQYQTVESEVASLTPASYPGSTATLQDARSKIKTGAADLRTAWQDAKQIVQGLKTLNRTTKQIVSPTTAQ